MGRGRAKAKQTKVARELKYRSFGTDFGSLAAELRHEGSEVPPAYADLAEESPDADESDEDRPRSWDEDDDGYTELRKSG
ncbi:Protein of unknown function [Microlunatus sagamiharensis]|uniref:DUF3073 domain-containing protein n=1 Tax=Microlunatus sagamiharensis TaxID=546874 RepID=A0A1H2N115_9ACTN|nr:DUF3073 domain-containing protein [Microlunatus sagamiharensis]SDU98851.1 Protein of unknown function [Microlunatus sagamiharensis]